MENKMGYHTIHASKRNSMRKGIIVNSVFKDLRDNHSFAFIYPVLVKAPGHHARYIKPNDFYTPALERHYSISNHVICFIHDNCLFITPFTKEREVVLLQQDFCETIMAVPFSKETPCVDPDKTTWNNLCDEVKHFNR